MIKEEKNNKKPEHMEPILVEGFIVLTSLPSEALLLKTIYEYYKEKVGIIKNIMTLPQHFANRFKTQRRKVYQKLNRYTVKIAPGLYLLPTEKLIDFQREKNKILLGYREIEKDIHEYIKKDDEYTRLVKELNIQPKNPSITDRVSFNLIPLRLSEDFFENYLENKAKQKIQEADQEKQRLLEEIKTEMQTQRKKMIENAINDLEEKLKNVYQRISENAKKKITSKTVKSIHKTINEIQELAEATNTQRLVDERIQTAKQLLESAEQGTLTQDSNGIKNTVTDPRLRALIDTLGL